MLRIPVGLLTTVLLPTLAACGGTIQPRAAEPVPAVGRLPGLPARPEKPAPTPTTEPQVRSMAQQICRGAAMPRGWIAVGYTTDEQACPKRTDLDNQYNLAVIHRYADLPMGASLRVCADQPRPVNWGLEPGAADTAEGCPGARVKPGNPTAYVMRRLY